MYELVNDLKTGDLRITKDKTGVGTYGDPNLLTLLKIELSWNIKHLEKMVDVETGKGTVRI